MDTFLGFLELIGWVVVIIAIAAAITYSVIKVFPGGRRQEPPSSG
jgi:hypothetical protein